MNPERGMKREAGDGRGRAGLGRQQSHGGNDSRGWGKQGKPGKDRETGVLGRQDSHPAQLGHKY